MRRLGDPDLVLIGDSSWDYGVVSALAGQLGWPALASVVSASAEGGRLRVTRKVGAATEVLEVSGPAVLAVAASRAEQQVPGMKEVLAARKRPMTKVTLADLGVSPSVKVGLPGHPAAGDGHGPDVRRHRPGSGGPGGGRPAHGRCAVSAPAIAAARPAAGGIR